MPLSQRQMEYAIIAFQCCTEEPKVFALPSPSLPAALQTVHIPTLLGLVLTLLRRVQPDFEAFRAAAGLASANSARELWRVTRKKMKEEYEGLCQKVVDEKVCLPISFLFPSLSPLAAPFP